jgi:hypothetical protein
LIETREDFTKLFGTDVKSGVFRKKLISAKIFWNILNSVKKSIPTEKFEEIEIYSVIH